ncbi:uncharacterized protein CDAR_258141 [Caerostris darwini]|uniref:Uncharacterized protein n=1 Tax=Caerostris darwini TaxID=1538125 RepID=A0AAV4WYQ3_9ARAC|nr:uncharacterized protein CDAR_258141 [Caerostris darwini]
MLPAVPKTSPSGSDIEVLQESPNPSAGNQSELSSNSHFAEQAANVHVGRSASGLTISSSEEFKTAEESVPTTACVSEEHQPAVLEIDRQSRTGLQEPLVDVDQPADETVTAAANRGCCDKLNAFVYPFASRIRKSKYILLPLFLLFGMPISAGYMGARYVGKCPMSKEVPFLVFLMGIIGVMLIFARLTSIIIRKCNIRGMRRYEMTTVTVTAVFLIACFMITEMTYFYPRTPIFDHPGDKNFCDRRFYNYTYYMNFGVIVVGVLTALLHIPTNPISSPLFNEE